MIVPEIDGVTTRSRRGQPRAAVSSQTIASSVIAEAAAAVLLRQAGPEEPLGGEGVPELRRLPAAARLLAEVRLAEAGGDPPHRLP